MRCLSIWLLVILAAGCKPSTPPAPTVEPPVARPADEPPTAEALALAAERRGFPIDLYAQVAAAEKGNVCLSPLSVKTALAMTAAGARGETQEELRRVLDLLPGHVHDHGYQTLIQRLSTGQGAGTELQTSNGVWARPGTPWRPEFRQTVSQDFNGRLFDVIFQIRPANARQQINDSIDKLTDGKVKDLIAEGQLTRDHRLVLTSAVYFKGPWDDKFDPAQTRPAPFTRADGTKVDVPVMHRKGGFRMRHFPAAGDDPEVSVAVLPYKGNQASMIVLLPAKPDGLPALERRLTGALWHKWAQSATSQRETELALPKFKVESGSDLKRPLRALGINLVFDPDRADLTGMHTGNDRLSVDFVAHKAVVDVTEEGTVAAAGTGVGVKKNGEPPAAFVADRPFLFLITAVGSEDILFVGRYVGP